MSRGLSSAAGPDLLVVGGGPVGLAVALGATARGLRVTVIEPRPAPIDKACGEGLMPAGLAALRALGVDPLGRDLLGITYVDGRHRATAAFPHGPGRGVRRTTLHAALAAAARDAGVSVRAASTTGLTQDAASVQVELSDGGRLRAPYVVAADGLHSPTRRRLGMDAPAHPGVRRHGLVRHYAVRPWSDRVEVHWSRIAEAYVTPLGDNLIGVALLTGAKMPYDVLLAGMPELVSRLTGVPTVGRDLGAGPFGRVAASRVSGRVLLVGDAGGYVDALTGEGVSVGLRQAEAAVAAVAADDPASYRAASHAVTASADRMTRALVWAATHTRTRRLIVPAAAAVPTVFAKAVALAAAAG